MKMVWIPGAPTNRPPTNRHSGSYLVVLAAPPRPTCGGAAARGAAGHGLARGTGSRGLHPDLRRGGPARGARGRARGLGRRPPRVLQWWRRAGARAGPGAQPASKCLSNQGRRLQVQTGTPVVPLQGGPTRDGRTRTARPRDADAGPPRPADAAPPPASAATWCSTSQEKTGAAGWCLKQRMDLPPRGLNSWAAGERQEPWLVGERCSCDCSICFGVSLCVGVGCI
jgi:hypothetical protein